MCELSEEMHDELESVTSAYDSNYSGLSAVGRGCVDSCAMACADSAF